MQYRLRQLRKLNDIILDEVAMDTGLSVGYLNRFERGEIKITNHTKRKRLENYIKILERKSKKLLNSLDSLHFNFYLKNPENISIKRENATVQYIIKGNLIEKYFQAFGLPIKKIFKITLDEKKMNEFLNKIGFRGPEIDTEQRIDGILASRFIKEI